MPTQYSDVTTRFLHKNERLILSKETEMPLVIEPNKLSSIEFLEEFLSANSECILNDLARYGAILLRGFKIDSEEDFERAILSIKGFKGISEAFMSEEGRVPVGKLKYVLHTNAVYKTGGTLYLGGFHNENYYSADVPSVISFCCFTPSKQGGETGIINMEKVYECFSEALKQKLESRNFFVSKWLLSDIASRYQISLQKAEEICKHFNLPIIGTGKKRFVTMHKPSVYVHPVTNKKALQINFFELRQLNSALRKCFINDYQGKTWFWHRLVWRLPEAAFKMLEHVYVMFASFFYSPKDSLGILWGKIKTLFLFNKKVATSFDKEKVESCFNKQEIHDLAKQMRDHYSSCLWVKGDILIVDNKKVVHAGMPGKGARTIRAMICDPLDISYSPSEPGIINCELRKTESVGWHLANEGIE